METDVNAPQETALASVRAPALQQLNLVAGFLGATLHVHADGLRAGPRRRTAGPPLEPLLRFPPERVDQNVRVVSCSLACRTKSPAPPNVAQGARSSSVILRASAHGAQTMNSVSAS